MTVSTASRSDLFIEVTEFYAHQMPLLELRDFEGFAGTFTADCVFGYDGAWRVTGRDAVLGGMRANIPRYGASTIRHWFENRQITVREDGAINVTASCLVSVTAEDGTVSFEPSCTVTDLLVRTSDGLRTASRIIRHDLADPGLYFARLAAGHD